jgi:adenylate cyclase
MPHAQHRFVAILAADIVGYSRLAEADEEYTYSSLIRLRADILNPGIAAYGGTLIKYTGDGFLAIFDSAHAAAEAALAMQRAIAMETAEQQPDRRIQFRMAVHLASIILEENDIYGDGVNIAARLQGYAEPGDVVISGVAAEQVSPARAASAIDLGNLPLRNLSRPVRAFSLGRATTPCRVIGDVLTGSEPRPSIAVLPFRKNQVDPAEGYFADGIVEDIIHALATLKELFVISRGSTLAYGGAELDTRAIGRELGVRYVLYGYVRRAGGRLRIRTELTDAETGLIINSEQYDGSISELFELQDRISLNVVKTIAPHVRERERVRAMHKRPENMTAYDLLLQALDLLYRMNETSFYGARGLLQQAMAHDPGYAPPYSYAAFWYVFRVGEIGSPDPDADAAAAAHYAASAIERDPGDPLALALYGHVHSFLLHDYKTATLLLERAVASGPNDAMAWSMSSATRGYVGDGAAAVRLAEQAVRLSPKDTYAFWHTGLLAQAHYVNGNYEEAVAWARCALAHNRGIRFTLRTLIVSLATLGRSEEAALAAHHLMRVQPDFRLALYERRCPFQRPILDEWIAQLRGAGLPD